MTTHVVATDGTGDFRTLEEAAAAARPGDEVIVRGGVYRGTLRPGAGTTWRAAEGERPILDGGWNGKQETSSEGSQILIAAEGVVIEGLAVRNTPGRGISVGRGHGAVIRNCSTDRTYGGGIILNAGEPLRDVLVTGCVVLRAGMSYGAGVRPQVSGSLNMIRCVNCVVEYTVVAYGHGEGINIGKGSVGCTVRGCVIFDNSHLGLYFNRSRNCLAAENLIFLTGFEQRQVGGAEWPGGLIYGDEVSETANSFPHSSGNRALRNVVVNCGTLIGVRNNKVADGYDTRLDEGTLIANNTLIGGPCTTRGINVGANQQGRPHGAAVIRDNVIHVVQAPAGVEIAASGGAALVWRRNAWSEQPPAACRSGEDVAAEGLANPGAALANQFPAGGHNVNLDNYRPVAGGPLALAGIGALGPGEPEPPVEPPPVDEVDWAALMALVNEAGVELVGVVAGLARAGELVQTLGDLIEKYGAAEDEL